MTTSKRPEFPEYGSGGDYAGARRGRRAFRYGVATAVLFTLGLWLSEQYLRYEETERLYLLALTHEPESARVLLRQAIKIDTATEERPTAKYAAALAEREEDDRRLTAYEKAYELDPANAFVAMRFGCELFEHKEMRRAHELFRAAYDHDPRNALPLYLEAATLPFIEEGDLHLDESFQLIERANESGMPLVFQQPLWFSTLPLRGEWHAHWRRQIVYEVLTPVQTFSEHVFDLAEQDLTQEFGDTWDTRLATMQQMSWRIAHDSEPEVGAPQALVGLRIELRAVQLRQRFQNLAELAEQETHLNEALEIVNRFEFTREERIAMQKTRRGVPLQLVSQSLVLLFIIYLGVYVASRAMRAGRQSWTLRHSVWARAVILGACFLLLLLLILVSSMGWQPTANTFTLTAIAYLWFGVLGVATGAGAFYPGFMLPLAHQVMRERKPDQEEAGRFLVMARRARRIAYVSLMRRYYGILLGLFAITTCLWILGFRILCALYPWQIKLLTPGLGGQEHEAVRSALRVLGWH